MPSSSIALIAIYVDNKSSTLLCVCIVARILDINMRCLTQAGPEEEVDIISVVVVATTLHLVLCEDFSSYK